jgi:hypothetical protein
MSSFGLSRARAEASRRHGAKSRGPKTPGGKALSSQNALKHGLRAQQCVVLPGERASAFDALKAALLEELGKREKLAKRTQSRRRNPGEIGVERC